MAFDVRFPTKNTLLVLLIAVIAVIMPWLTGVARADDGTSGNVGETIILPMTADCSSVPDTPEAKEELAKYKLCGYGLEPGEPSPMGVAIGNCGTLSLNVFDSRGGNMLWKAEMNSTVGPMAFASYSGDWLNTSTGAANGVGRSTGPNLGNWLDIFNIYTGPGYVYAKISTASLTTAYALTCYNSSFVASGANVTN